MMNKALNIKRFRKPTDPLLAVQNHFYKKNCSGCGIVFIPDVNYKVIVWKRHFLMQAIKDGGELSKKQFVFQSAFRDWDSLKQRRRRIRKRYVQVFKCLTCETHTVMDAEAFDRKSDIKDPKTADSPPLLPTSSTESTTAQYQPAAPKKEEKVKATQQAKGLQRFLQKKAKQGGQGNQQQSTSLSSFLVDLNKSKKP